MRKNPPRPTYKIAEFLPMALRRKMATRVYKEDEQGFIVCKTGRCPLGWLFADPPKGRLRQDRRLPSADLIARRIRREFPKLVGNTNLWDLEEYAVEFTGDWDSGKIKNLHTALGVPR